MRIITRVDIVNQNKLLIKNIIDINMLATAIFLRQLTFFKTNGFPPINVLNITLSCHKIYTEAMPEAINTSIMGKTKLSCKLK
jgi:hypothetical protein